MTEENLKIAVFVDFDNIEIGVKSTLNRNFDIGSVLEAIKERGEIVTKVAYGDWKRAGDHGRAMGQHAIHMVQRNLTPGGDKNGADINLALDALEMAFTRNHINAFVIVGGDSDFITLVEKLKQYDKKVFVVGGRAFTSSILQKNCHEFIAYENLIRSQSSGRRQPGRSTRPSSSETPLDKAMPLMRRALKILSDREVSPQLGLLKSTLLQLDSTFSERDYGGTTFRDFVEKLARTGAVNLKRVDRSLFVELREDAPETPEAPKPSRSQRPAPETPEASRPSRSRRPKTAAPEVAEPAAQSGNADVEADTSDDGTPPRVAEAVQVIRAVFEKTDKTPKWPMYLRNVKQLMKSVEPDFDEKEYGFSSLLDVVRQCQRAGVFRLERNRQGVLRIFQGDELLKSAPVAEPAEAPPDSPPETEVPVAAAAEPAEAEVPAVVAAEPEEVGAVQEVTEAKKAPARKRKAAATKTTKTTKKKAAKKTTKTTKKKAVKTTKKAVKTTKKAVKKTAPPAGGEE